MNLQRAIEEAGAPGKGYNTERGQDFSIDVDGLISWPHRLPDVNDFESDTWAIAGIKIKIGDVVEVPYSKEKGTLLFTDVYGGLCVVMLDEPDSTYFVHISNLTFVERPEKPVEHVFKGVNIHSREIPHNEHSAHRKMYYLPIEELRNMDSLKSYTVKITEEK